VESAPLLRTKAVVSHLQAITVSLDESAGFVSSSGYSKPLCDVHQLNHCDRTLTMNGRPKLSVGFRVSYYRRHNHRQVNHRVTGAAEVGMDDSPNQVTVMIGDNHKGCLVSVWCRQERYREG
jgi:hypothetical protein